MQMNVQINRRQLLQRAAAAGLIGAVGVRAPIAEANSLRLGQTAPPATLVTLDGRRLSTSELRGQVVILTFLATWCAPCRTELPLLSDYLARHASRGLMVLGFSLDTPDRLPQLRQLAAPLRFPVGLLAASSAPGYGRIWRIPVSFTLDRAGRLVDNGWRDKPPAWTAERLERVVTPLLA